MFRPLPESVTSRSLRGTIRGFPAAAMVALICTVSQAGIEAPDDCGNSPFSSPCVIEESQISVKTFIGGNIEEPGDIDVFQFEVQAEHTGQLYMIQTIIPSSDPLSDTYLRLLDVDGSTELLSDNDSGEGAGSKVLWSPDTAGVYYVEITQFIPGETGLYQVSVFRSGPAPSDDHGDTYSTATEIGVGNPPVSGSTELSADVDYFKFLVQPNRFYDIETSNLETGSDTVITLYEEDGVTRLDSDDQGGREFNASRISWISPEDLSPGNLYYYVEVRQFLTGTSGVGYSLSVTTTGSPQALPTGGKSTQGQIAEPGDIDAYIFPATGVSAFTARLQTATDVLNLFELRLLDTDGVSVLKSQKNLELEDLEYTLEETDHFYLLVTEESNGGPYTLSATVEAAVGDPDLNKDGIVNHEDLLMMIRAYQTENP